MNTPNTTKTIAAALAAFGMLALAPIASGAAVFDFINNSSPFDGNQGIGTTDSKVDGAFTINLETVDIIAEDGTLASANAANATTNIFSSFNGLGVNSSNNLNTDTGGNEAALFDPGEGWVFESDIKVNLDFVDFGSFSAGEQITISSSAFTTIVLDDTDLDGSGIYNFGTLVVDANTQITMQSTSTDTGGFHLQELGLTAIPEPSAFFIPLAIGFWVLVGRRRR